MLISDYIAQMLEEMLEQSNGTLEIRRNDMASKLGCAPSQINYVITSRFTPQHGYLVESHRGGGGYVRIVRKEMHRDEYLMHFFHSIGTSLSEAEAVAMLRNLCATRAVETDMAAVMRAAERAAGGSESAWLVRRLDGDAVRETLVASAEDARIPAALRGTLLTGRSVLAEGEERWLSIPIARAGLVYIFGGGHVSQALAPVLERVGFRTVIYDDRPEFADRTRFPGAERVLCGDFACLQEQVQISPDDYVVIMTRGHLADYEVLSRTLRSGARYLGCIGSRKKLALCRERLLAAGFTAEEYARVHAPIGLAIGAETPEEIAVSVAAELIAVRSGKA